MRQQRRGESSQQSIGGIVVILAIIGGVIWYFSSDKKEKGGGTIQLPGGIEVRAAPPTIVGRWDVVGTADGQPAHSDYAGKYIRFNQDGTFKANIPYFTTDDGKYRIISNNAIEVDVPGLLFGRNKSELKYDLKDANNLQIDFLVLLGNVRFKKNDSGN